MNFQLTQTEIDLFRLFPEDMLLDLCRDLDMILPEKVDKIKLALKIVPIFVSYTQRYGLPFHKLNRSTLEQLSERELQILAELCRVKPTIRAILKHGTKVFKNVHLKGTYRHAIRLNMITFLGPMIRYQLSQTDLS
jgi:hypothetical protein